MKRSYYANPVTADRIDNLLKDHKMTNRFVADIYNCDRKTIGMYRRGEMSPSVAFVRWMCATFQVSADWLLDL